MPIASPSSIDDASLRAGEGESGALEQGEANFQRAIRDRIRDNCRTKLQACAADPLYAVTERDVDLWMGAMEEQNLSGPDVRTQEDKTRIAQELAGARLREFLGQARKAGDIIREAEENKWIMKSSAEKWRSRMKQGTFYEKKDFIEKKLPEYKRNWQALATDFKKAAEMERTFGISKEERAGIPELVELHAADFKDGSLRYPERRNRVNKALAFLKALEKDRQKGGEMKGDKGMQKLYAQAKAQLEDAAKRGVISSWKVGTWLKRIFQTGASEKRIQEFLTVQLGSLDHNWSEVKRRFDAIEDKRRENGTPRSFHFVHLNLFLSWNYRKREAYVEEAEQRFTDMEEERENFLRIRHALDSKDWEEAEGLIAAEKRDTDDLSLEDQGKLHSMERFLQTHRPAEGQGQEGKKEKPNDLECVQRMRNYIQQLPSSMQPVYTESLKRGYGAFWTNCTVDYNLVWCQEHGRWDPKTQMTKEEEAKEYTPQRIEKGHGQGFEANDVRGANTTQAAVRGQEDKAAPQWLFLNHSSAYTMALTYQQQQYNRKFWYWTSAIHEGVAYEQHRNVVKSFHRPMKSLARDMESRGIIYTHTGDVQYKASPLAQKKQSKSKQPEASLALSA